MVSCVVDAEVFLTITLNNTTEIVYILKLIVYNHSTYKPANALGKIGCWFFCHGAINSVL